MDDLSTSGRLVYVLTHTLRSPLGLSALVGGAIATIPFHSPLPLVAGVVSYVVLAYRNLHDEDYLRKIFSARSVRQDELSEKQIEELLESMDFESRQRMRYILQLQREIGKEARGTDVQDYSKRDLDRIAGKLMPVVRQAFSLATRRQKLNKYLTNVDDRSLRQYCISVQQKMNATADPVQREQYEKALRAREAELQSYQSIKQAVLRIDSQLENVEATFASWKAKVIRLKTADLSVASTESESLVQELDGLSSEINLLDSSVSEALASDPAPLTVSSSSH